MNKQQIAIYKIHEDDTACTYTQIRAKLSNNIVHNILHNGIDGPIKIIDSEKDQLIIQCIYALNIFKIIPEKTIHNYGLDADGMTMLCAVKGTNCEIRIPLKYEKVSGTK